MSLVEYEYAGQVYGHVRQPYIDIETYLLITLAHIA